FRLAPGRQTFCTRPPGGTIDAVAQPGPTADLRHWQTERGSSRLFLLGAGNGIMRGCRLDRWQNRPSLCHLPARFVLRRVAQLVSKRPVQAAGRLGAAGTLGEQALRAIAVGIATIVF